MQFIASCSIIIISGIEVIVVNDGRMNDMFKQMEELFLKVDNLTLEIKMQKKHMIKK